MRAALDAAVEAQGLEEDIIDAVFEKDCIKDSAYYADGFKDGLERGRDEAIEEAAKVLEGRYDDDDDLTAAAIRALKDE